MLTEMLVLLALVAAIGAWLDTMRQREYALRAAQNLCKRHEVQLLDHSVGLCGLKLRRHDGRLTVERHYRFEVSIDGADRQEGSLWMVHGQLAGVSATWLRAPDVRTLDANAAVTDLLERISHDHTT